MLILASQSPRRRELMGIITKDFAVRPSDFDESKIQEVDPDRLVQLLAEGKARAVSAGEKDVVIGCDTIVVLDGRVFGKPAHPEEAKQMLRVLSGRTHTVMSGVCVLWQGKATAFTCKTDVTFYPLDEAEIAEYVASGDPLDKAGSYGIQGKGALFVKKIDGDYFNVVGLPVAELSRELRRLGTVV